MAGLVPAIYAPAIERDGDPIVLARMAGTRPAMTVQVAGNAGHDGAGSRHKAGQDGAGSRHKAGQDGMDVARRATQFHSDADRPWAGGNSQ
jgi:hypothetical protein